MLDVSCVGVGRVVVDLLAGTHNREAVRSMRDDVKAESIERVHCLCSNRPV